ncbi:MAG: cytochrome d ubiquinol oxidase subunit II [Rhodothalassiaceae bacterium]
MEFDLAFIWAMLLAIAILAYVILDGFDLGVGILFPTLIYGEDRDTAMNTVAPVWDGNETWLILGGGGLLAAFPVAYAIVMPALYAPIIVMLLGLVFRGVAFEYRWRDKDHERFWDYSFAVGSIVATFAQGIVLGAFIQGIEVDGRAYGGGWWDWLSPFSLLTGVALVAGYGLLGAAWLILKTEGRVRDRCYRLAMPLTYSVVGLIALVSLITPFLDGTIRARWFDWPNILFVSPVPLLVAALAYWLYRAVKGRKDNRPFPLALGLFVLSYIGLGISLYPYVVPRNLTVWQAAAPDSSLLFLLVGALVLLPLIIGYTAYSYWIFRGKVRAGEGYH